MDKSPTYLSIRPSVLFIGREDSDQMRRSTSEPSGRDLVQQLRLERDVDFRRGDLHTLR